MFLARMIVTGMRIRIRRSDPVIYALSDLVLFSLDPGLIPGLDLDLKPDPDPDPTCNNGFIKLFSS